MTATRTGAGAATTSVPAQPLDLDQVVRRESPGLLAYLSRRTSDPAEAADLLGDVLVVIWRQIDAMPGDPAATRMWMFGIARKVLAGGYRTARRRQALTDRLRHELATEQATAALDGTPTTGPTDPRLERSSVALDQLNTSEVEIVNLVHFDDFTLGEAAHHLHLRLSTTRSRYHRARNRLKRLLEQ